MSFRLNGVISSLLLSLTVSAISCSQAATPRNALVMGYNIDAITTFDPAQIGENVTDEILTNTCDTLVRFDPNDESKIIPRFAKSWDVSEDGKTITFHLNEGAVFPSGNPVTADDAAWSLQRVALAGLANAVTMTAMGFTKENVQSRIIAKDKNTLTLTLDQPYPVNLVLQALAANRVSAVMDKKKILDNQVNGDFGNHYLTTRTECVGPYRLDQWHASDVVVLKANESYYGTPPLLKTVLIKHVAEPGSQALMLKQGDIDVARDLVAQQLQVVEKSKDTHVSKVLSPSLTYWMLNMNTHPALQHVKVRQALRYLIDYDGLSQSILKFSGVTRQSYVPIGSFGALDQKNGNPYTFNLEEARRLLKEAGYEHGLSFTLYVGSTVTNGMIAENVQYNASKIGVAITIERMANAQLFSKLRAREFQSAMASWVPAYPDAHANSSRLVYNPDPRPEAKLTQLPAWRVGWYNEAMNQSIDSALFEKNIDKREQIYMDLQKDYLEQGAILVMFQGYNVAGVRNELKNWTWNGFSVYYDLASK